MKTNLKLLSATGLLCIITAGGIKAQNEKWPTSGNMGLAHIPVWLTSGNNGTNPNIHFLGTTDNKDLVFRTNNFARLRITSAGNVGIGTSSPSAKLEVAAGDAIINGITAGRGKGFVITNTTYGFEALRVNTTGLGNTAIGFRTLYSNTTGQYNTATGIGALIANTTGSSNTASGLEALIYNTDGSNNTATGKHALQLNKTGNYNTANGAEALLLNTTGSYNTALGFRSFNSSTSFSNSTAIGYNAAITASNQVSLGDANVTSLFCRGAYAATTILAPNMYVSAEGQIMRSTTGVGGGGWGLTGNTGTIDGVNFMGTIDDVPLNFVVNNQKAGKIDHKRFNTFYGYLTGNSISTGRDNTGIGVLALRSNTIGESNTAVGSQCLYFNIGGNSNTALGEQALSLNTYGNFNTAIGSGTLIQNTEGNGNTATGTSALFKNKTGRENTAVGNVSLHENITGSFNTAIGTATLLNNTTGNNNTGVGYLADVSAGNFTNVTAIGYNAKVNNSNQVRLGDNNITSLYCMGAYAATTTIAPNMYVSAEGQIMRSTTEVGGGGWGLTGNAGTIDGVNFIGTTDNVPLNIKVNNQKAGRIEIDGNTANTFYGYLSGSFNTGIFNTANGYMALLSNTTGRGNTANGHHALLSNTTGIFNTANGRGALQANTTGSNNTAYGANAMARNTTGEWNTALGENGILSNTTGSYNTGSGYQALVTNTTGNSNTALGYFADVMSGDLTNATAIGFDAKVNNSNKVRIGNNNVTVVESAAGSWTVSDGRFKSNITEEVKGLEFIKLLRPVTYNFDVNKFETFLTRNYPDSIKASRKEMMNKSISKLSTIRQSGFVAQEVEEAAKKSGYNFNGVHAPENATDNYSISYEKLVVPLVKAVQELSNKNDALQTENEALKKRLDKIEQMLLTKSTTVETLTSARLEQNAPNPYKENTLINYFVPLNTGRAVLNITDSKGALVKTFSLKEGKGQVLLQSGQLATGTYQYSLFINGRLSDTRQMVLVR